MRRAYPHWQTPHHVALLNVSSLVQQQLHACLVTWHGTMHHFLIYILSHNRCLLSCSCSMEDLRSHHSRLPEGEEDLRSDLTHLTGLPASQAIEVKIMNAFKGSSCSREAGPPPQCAASPNRKSHPRNHARYLTSQE